MSLILHQKLQRKAEIMRLRLLEDDHSKIKNTDDFKNKYCEVIHIGIVCAGHTSNLYLHSLMKSIFMYRVNPLHLHILTNDESKLVLKTLFKTWQIPQVTVKFYDLYYWLKDIRWIPNTHYSGNYGLLKLVFPKMISANVTKKIMILDTDLTVVSDIYGLWKMFDEFNHKQTIGMIENMSEYYLGKLQRSHHWPALGKGYNSGVLLYDLSKMKATHFEDLWVNMTKRLLPIYGSVSLGDQDILNAFIVENPSLIYSLPCSWNTQMSDNSLANNCYESHRPKIIHWNSPKKLQIQHKSGRLFKSLANTVSEFNGNLLRTYPLLCDELNHENLPNVIPENDCAKFYYPPSKYYRTLLYLTPAYYIVGDDDITFVTHLSFDRFQSLEDLADTWAGPISVTLYMTDQELAQFIQLLSESEVLQKRTNISYHIVFKDGDFYPINILKNVGLKNIKTPFVFTADVDFVPVRNLYQILRENIKSMGNMEKKALVVPAFEMTSRSADVPASKLDLIEALDKEYVQAFLSDISSRKHAATDYKKWRQELEPYKVTWALDYEPYVVLPNTAIHYDERFFGFGWNQASHIMELEAQGYEFTVLPDVFIVRKQFCAGYDHVKYSKWPNYRLCLQSLKKNFVDELNHKYNNKFAKLIPVYVNERKKRDVESTTSVFESTDHFLVWGGKEKANGKVEYRTKKGNKSSKTYFSKEEISKETPDAEEYVFYHDNHPYPSTIYSPKGNKTAYEQILKKFSKKLHYQQKTVGKIDYDYNSEELKHIRDSTTARDVEEGSTIIADEHLREIDKDYGNKEGGNF